MRTLAAFGLILAFCVVGSLAHAALGKKIERKGLTCARIIHLIDDSEITDTAVKMNKVLKLEFKNTKGLTVKNGQVYPGIAVAVIAPDGQKIMSSDNALAIYAENGLPSIFASTITATIQTGSPLEEGKAYKVELRLFDLKGVGEILYQTDLVIQGENKIDDAQAGTITPDGLTMDRVALAVKNEERSVAAFTPGEVIQFFSLNVKGLQKGQDGLYAFDMDVSVMDEAGKVLSSRQGLLGGKGQADLKDGVLKSPVVTINTAKYAPGKYRAMVKVYDRNSSRSVTAMRSFAVFNIGQK